MWYYTSDLHFGHANIIKYCDRPFNSVEEMNDNLVVNWNSRVQPDDTVFILGDLTMTDCELALKYLKMLNGHKILIPGNHDTYVFKNSFPENGLSSNFEVITEAMTVVTDPFVNTRIVLCHYPLAVWRGKEHGDLHFYGHVHNSTQEMYPYLYKIDNAYNVGVDVQGYYPRTAQEIINSKQK